MRILRSLACLTIGIAAAGLVSAQTIQINRDNKTIAISSTDEATATADIAAITIGFEIFGPDALTVSGGSAQGWRRRQGHREFRAGIGAQ
jgi:uncharacterized protein YggE